jgi:hypothetical protein
MALRFHKATAEDLEAWAAELRRLAEAMEEVALAATSAEAKVPPSPEM